MTMPCDAWTPVVAGGQLPGLNREVLMWIETPGESLQMFGCRVGERWEDTEGNSLPGVVTHWRTLTSLGEPMHRFGFPHDAEQTSAAIDELRSKIRALDRFCADLCERVKRMENRE